MQLAGSGESRTHKKSLLQRQTTRNVFRQCQLWGWMLRPAWCFVRLPRLCLAIVEKQQGPSGLVAEIQLNRGILFGNQGEVDKAMAAWQATLAADPGCTEARSMLERARRREEHGQ
ncbi:hypothetical protein NKDENANG_00943 [Candidatus Entotheonellaceae bacterium PAL068K]